MAIDELWVNGFSISSTISHCNDTICYGATLRGQTFG